MPLGGLLPYDDEEEQRKRIAVRGGAFKPGIGMLYHRGQQVHGSEALTGDDDTVTIAAPGIGLAIPKGGTGQPRTGMFAHLPAKAEIIEKHPNWSWRTKPDLSGELKTTYQPYGHGPLAELLLSRASQESRMGLVPVGRPESQPAPARGWELEFLGISPPEWKQRIVPPSSGTIGAGPLMPKLEAALRNKIAASADISPWMIESRDILRDTPWGPEMAPEILGVTAEKFAKAGKLSQAMQGMQAVGMEPAPGIAQEAQTQRSEANTLNRWLGHLAEQNLVPTRSSVQGAKTTVQSLPEDQREALARTWRQFQLSGHY